MGTSVLCISLTVTWKIRNVQDKNDRIMREEYHGQFFFPSYLAKGDIEDIQIVK